MVVFFSLRYPLGHSNVSIERFSVKSDAKRRGTNCWTLSSFEQFFQYISMASLSENAPYDLTKQ